MPQASVARHGPHSLDQEANLHTALRVLSGLFSRTALTV